MLREDEREIIETRKPRFVRHLCTGIRPSNSASRQWLRTPSRRLRRSSVRTGGKGLLAEHILVATMKLL
jgi:hypothetical protein